MRPLPGRCGSLRQWTATGGAEGGYFLHDGPFGNFRDQFPNGPWFRAPVRRLPSHGSRTGPWGDAGPVPAPFGTECEASAAMADDPVTTATPALASATAML